MPWTIYCHTHTESGRRYVGLTKRTWQRRWSQHVCQARSSKGQWHFPNAICKYGKDAFSHEVLEVCETLEEANAAEEKWISHFDTTNRKKGFNLVKGGEHTPQPASRENPWDRPGFREKHAAVMKGVVKKPEFLAACSAGNKEVWSRPGHREKMAEACKDIFKPEVRRRLQEAASGRALSPETRVKISATHVGMKRTPEHVENSAKALRARGARLRAQKTHVNCRVHGQVSLDKCYSSVKSDGRVAYTCRSCSKKRSRERQRRLRRES